METEQMIKRLRYLAEEHKNDKVGTCQTRWSDLCSDVADRLEEQTASCLLYTSPSPRDVP